MEELIDAAEQPSFQLGIHMLKTVQEKLAATLAHYRYASPHLNRVTEDINAAAGVDGDLEDLPLEQVIKIIKARSEACHLVKTLYVNAFRDITLRSTHRHKRFSNPLYLTDQIVYSSNCFKPNEE